MMRRICRWKGEEEQQSCFPPGLLLSGLPSTLDSQSLVFFSPSPITFRRFSFFSLSSSLSTPPSTLIHSFFLPFFLPFHSITSPFNISIRIIEYPSLFFHDTLLHHLNSELRISYLLFSRHPHLFVLTPTTIVEILRPARLISDP